MIPRFPQPTQLTSEQRDRIERNREEALRRRLAKEGAGPPRPPGSCSVSSSSPQSKRCCLDPFGEFIVDDVVDVVFEPLSVQEVLEHVRIVPEHRLQLVRGVSGLENADFHVSPIFFDQI